ncbi:MAG: phosphoglycerate kinase [Candidatus Fischerbacteria bacterium RBG_13_37_8]|uniref:Phosphoglycerate kinase n=1 Tax=Candidatus Fischerbacteria bacterium RBG_13_37_8 TaxID=1817863 RepID=A0A1F5VP92_9BACT|nr:MAG: phosphoglycerate kinase [Candidatus Fischerbacteria bacterium RBG_13_37_8]
MNKVTIKDLDIEWKTIFIRVDYNVPLSEAGVIQDDTRIILSQETINYALEKNCRIILASHLGRPKGNRIASMSLKPAAVRLSELLRKEVKFVDDCIGEKVASEVKALQNGEILLLENLRYYIEETKNNPAFAKQLASLAEIYIDDAFGAVHRAHASVQAIAEFFNKKGIGLLMQKEVYYLSKVLEAKEHPFVAILGGAKVSDKIEIIESLVQKVDILMICGAMAFTFLKSTGYDIGTSLVEDDKLEIAQSLIEKVGATRCKLIFPLDFVVVDEVHEDAPAKTIQTGKRFENKKGVDIGSETIKLYKEVLENAAMIFWNGPAGIFEIEAFSAGTLGIAEAVSASHAVTVVGGGDTVSAVKKAGVADKISHISTGGGASLEYIAGKSLPGLAVIPDK